MSDLRPVPEELLRHTAFLTAVARGIVRDEHLAEDVVQQAFLRALAHRPTVRVLPAWLTRVVRNLARNVVRSESRRTRREHGAARAEVQSAQDSAAVELALQRAVAEAVHDLHEPYRTVVHLRYFRQLAPVRIAAELGVSPKTIESRLTRAHALLRTRLERAWSAQDPRARALWIAQAPTGLGGTVLGGLWMSKPALLLALSGVSLLGVFFTWRAVASARGERSRDVTEGPRVLAASSLEPELRAAVETSEAREPEAVIPEAQPEAPRTGNAALESLLPRLALTIDASLDGRFDPSLLLDVALLVAQHPIGDPPAELDVTGQLRLPVQDLPEGLEADLCVSKPNRRQETVLTLEVRAARLRPLIAENFEREAPSFRLATWTDLQGVLRHTSLLTRVSPERRTGSLAQDPSRLTHGMKLYTPLSDPAAWNLSASGMDEIEGSRQPDGSRGYQTASWDVPQVLEGGPWPRVADLERLNRLLHERRDEVQARARR